ncbi:MAG: ATP synthase F0 subunit B [Myxococcota bacterium]
MNRSLLPRLFSPTALATGLVALGLCIAPEAHAASEGGLQLLPEMPVASWAEAMGAPYGFRLVGLLLLFVLLIFPVNAFVFQPLLRVLDEREERIAGTKTRAEQLEAQTREVLTRYERTIAETRETTEQKRRGALEEVRDEAQRETAAARSDAEQQIERARSEVASALEGARSGLRAQAEELARQAASQVLGRAL